MLSHDVPNRHRARTRFAPSLPGEISVLPFLVVLLLALLSAAPCAAPRTSTGPGSPDASDPGYVGALACAECHAKEYEAFRQTAHNLSSRLASEETVLGRFTPGNNILKTRDPDVWFEMTDRNGSLYQTAAFKDSTGIHRLTAPMDIVIGSGKIAQTYLYWDGRQLYQLPVTYYTRGGRWINSPGYTDGQVNFTRPIRPRCLECHATYFEASSYDTNTYGKYILGISCERCHGPGAAHLAYHAAGSTSSGPDPIVNPGRLSRQRLFDVCDQCHAGAGDPVDKPFSFRPGQPLAGYLRLASNSARSLQGVHSGGPLSRLSRSRCFQMSPEMTCLTCHNVHDMERGKLALFSARCLKCHQPHDCGVAKKIGPSIRNNCIDCHMPQVREAAINMQMPGGVQLPWLRDHYIRIPAVPVHAEPETSVPPVH